MELAGFFHPLTILYVFRLNPTYENAMNNLANIYLKHDRSMEAEQLLLKAIKIKPHFAAAWMNLGLAQLAQKRYKVDIFIDKTMNSNYSELLNDAVQPSLLTIFRTTKICEALKCFFQSHLRMPKIVSNKHFVYVFLIRIAYTTWAYCICNKTRKVMQRKFGRILRGEGVSSIARRNE